MFLHVNLISFPRCKASLFPIRTGNKIIGPRSSFSSKVAETQRIHTHASFLWHSSASMYLGSLQEHGNHLVGYGKHMGTAQLAQCLTHSEMLATLSVVNGIPREHGTWGLWTFWWLGPNGEKNNKGFSKTVPPPLYEGKCAQSFSETWSVQPWRRKDVSHLWFSENMCQSQFWECPGAKESKVLSSLDHSMEDPWLYWPG